MRLLTWLKARLNGVVKSEFWFGGASSYIQNGTAMISPSQDLERRSIEMLALCVDARQNYRSSATADITGKDASLIKSILNKSKSYTTVSNLIALMSIDYDTLGNSCFYLSKQNGTFDRLDTSVLQATVKDGFIVSYSDPITGSSYLASNVFHFKRLTNLTRGILGRSIVEEIQSISSVNVDLSLYYQRFFASNCMPDTILEFPKDTILSSEQVVEVQNSWAQKYNGPLPLKTLGVLYGGGKISKPSSEIDYSKSYDNIREIIRIQFRVPRIVLGDTRDVNFTNAVTSFQVFQINEVNAFLRRLSDELTYFFNSHGYTVKFQFESRTVLNGSSAFTPTDGTGEAIVPPVTPAKRVSDFDGQRSYS